MLLNLWLVLAIKKLELDITEEKLHFLKMWKKSKATVHMYVSLFLTKSVNIKSKLLKIWHVLESTIFHYGMTSIKNTTYLHSCKASHTAVSSTFLGWVSYWWNKKIIFRIHLSASSLIWCNCRQMYYGICYRLLYFGINHLFKYMQVFAR